MLKGSSPCNETLPANVGGDGMRAERKGGAEVCILRDRDGSGWGEGVGEGQVALPFDKGITEVRRGGDLGCSAVRESTGSADASSRAGAGGKLMADAEEVGGQVHVLGDGYGSGRGVFIGNGSPVQF